jgi:hypothetical protein
VLVFKEGRVNQSLAGEAITSQEIVRASLVRGGADARRVA